MFHRSHSKLGKLLGVTAVSIVIGGSLLLPFGNAQPQSSLQSLKSIQEQIKRDGRLPSGPMGTSYWIRARSLYPKSRILRSANGIAKTSYAVTTNDVGEPPEGFGKGFIWDRSDDRILLVMFINAADPLGVSVSGLEQGDQIQVQSAAGIASFSEDTGNPLASSIVGLLAKGADAAAGLAGHPELVPVIDQAEAFAKDQFKATNAKTKRRDSFGVDPGSGHKAREEGGILVCLPEDGGTYYSGNEDKKDRWIKENKERTDPRRPDHIVYGFFPIQANAAHNTRTVHGNGQLFVLPWDWKFEDNAGYYKVFMQIKRRNGPVPQPVIGKKTLSTKRP